LTLNWVFLKYQSFLSLSLSLSLSRFLLSVITLLSFS
jgi:hypothetical protein